MNQLITKSKKLNLTSLGAISNNGSKNSNISISLPSLINKTDNVIAISFSIIHAEIPNSFYLVNSTNNQIIINYVLYSLPYGNYNATTLMSALLALLPTGFNITFNPVSVKYTFTFTSSFLISKTSTINSIIGGDTFSDMISLLNSLTMPYVVNCLPLSRVNLRSKQLSYGNYNQYDGTGDVVISCQNNSCLGGCIMYNNFSGLTINFEDDLSDLRILNIRLTDDKNNELDLNGQHFYFTLQFDIKYIPTESSLSFSKIVNSVVPTLDE